MKQYFSLRKVCWFDCLRFEARRYLKVVVQDPFSNVVPSTVSWEERKAESQQSRQLVDVVVTFSALETIKRFSPNLGVRFSILSLIWAKLNLFINFINVVVG